MRTGASSLWKVRLPVAGFRPIPIPLQSSIDRDIARIARQMSTRSYLDAISHLNTLQTNAATLAAVQASGGRPRHIAITEMVEYLERIGYTTEDLNKLNVIHVAGTKGKGSTCAFTESILRHSRPNWKTGLYTSPHIVAVRERIRINGSPISEDEFAKLFFEVWDRLDQSDVRDHESTPKMPAYFRFLTLLAYHTFLTLKVDVTVLEVGLGGAYDSTNIVPKPIVTGITALGYDHVKVLGNTLKEIAWNKAGIFKPGVPALTVNQQEEAMEAIRKQAQDCQVSDLHIVSPDPAICSIKLGVAGAHQVENASLAAGLAQTFLRSQGDFASDQALPEEFARGLANTWWPCRCQTVADPVHPKTTWFLDGAHTAESLRCCIQWFASPDKAFRPRPGSEKRTRILIFNCTHGRSGPSLLAALQTTATAQLRLHKIADGPTLMFDHVVFCTNSTYADGSFKGDFASMEMEPAARAELKVQRELSSAWSDLVPKFPITHNHVLPSIEHAVSLVRNVEKTDDAGQVDVLVTGSLHLVGGVVEVAGLAEVALHPT